MECVDLSTAGAKSVINFVRECLELERVEAEWPCSTTSGVATTAATGAMRRGRDARGGDCKSAAAQHQDLQDLLDVSIDVVERDTDGHGLEARNS